ncbi:MAG: ABC transporter ATP-binding protein/permease [Tenericutes bacterium]|nr:ABC transporter ATP-binding protein/permease [Mycoplasmatota bacterium]
MIRLENVSKYYKSNTLVSVGMRKISLELKLGEFVAITGESGSGKSTLLNILSGLDTFEEGEFFLFGEPTSHYTIAQWEAYRAAYVGFVFQNYNIIDSYTVYQNVLLSLEFQGYDEASRKDRALEIIERVGLSHRVHHKASKLSGGEKQRTVIARALAKDCPAILCDEPTGNLDSKSGEEIIKLLHEISHDKLVIIVTHQFDEVAKYATRRVKMSDGEIIEDIKLTKGKPKQIGATEVTQKKIDLLTTSKIAIRNLFAAPKKFTFMLLLQFVFVFLALLIYGTTTSLFHQSGLLPDSLDASEHQLVIQKIDETAFTQEEVDFFANHRYVRAVNDYETISNLFTSIGRTRIYSERTAILNSSDILEGRLPEQIREVVISEDLSIYLDVGILDEVALRTTTFEPFLFTIVGISSTVNRAVYFHDDFYTDPDFVFKSLVNRVTINVIDDDGIQDVRESSYQNYVIDDLLNDDEILVYVNYENSGTRDAVLTIETGYGTKIELDILATFQFSEAFSEVHLNQKNYDELLEYMTSLDHRYKIVLNVYDRYDGQRLLNAIDQDTYIIYYDALAQNQDYTSFGYILRVVSYLMIVIVALLLFTLLRVVFKNMIMTRKKDFAIYRSVGASKKFLGSLVFLEQIFQIIFGSILTLVFVFILMYFVPSIAESMRYIGLLDILIVFIVFSYMTIMIPIKFHQSIYEISVIDTLSKSAEV